MEMFANPRRFVMNGEGTSLFDKPVHTKSYPNEAEFQRGLNSHTLRVSLRPGAEASPTPHP
jgi:hypothetical protein